MPRQILIVEDDAVIREMVHFILEDAGYAVATAIDGRLGLNALRTTRYDLVLLDIAMPELDGLEVLKRLRERGHEMPVLMMTANSSAAVVREVMSLGGDGYLLKPFMPQDLLARVEGTLKPIEV